MLGQHAEDVGLSAVEEIKRCRLEAMGQFRSKAEKRFSEILCYVKYAFGFMPTRCCEAKISKKI